MPSVHALHAGPGAWTAGQDTPGVRICGVAGKPYHCWRHLSDTGTGQTALPRDVPSGIKGGLRCKRTASPSSQPLPFPIQPPSILPMPSMPGHQALQVCCRAHNRSQFSTCPTEPSAVVLIYHCGATMAWPPCQRRASCMLCSLAPTSWPLTTAGRMGGCITLSGTLPEVRAARCFPAAYSFCRHLAISGKVELLRNHTLVANVEPEHIANRTCWNRLQSQPGLGLR